jgi:predicted nucleic acid-binding protein
MNTLADSGYFVGLFNAKDHHHARCKSFFATYTGKTTTTWAVFTEVCALLTHSKQRAFFAWAAKAQELGYLRIESPPADAVHALWQMMDKYEDLPMDFCDASLVYLASSLKVHRIATIDLKDFSVYRLPGNKRFTHVLDE